MSTERKQRYELMTCGYIRSKSKQYCLDIPSDIVSIIFMFYFIKVFNIEYGKRIKCEDNFITNISDSMAACFNTTVIDGWMVPDSGGDFIFTLRVKIVKQTDTIVIGIVQQGYKLDDSLLVFHKSYGFANDGNYFHSLSLKGTADAYRANLIRGLVSLNYRLVSLHTADDCLVAVTALMRL